MTLLSVQEEKMELENANQESSSKSEGEILSHYGSSKEEDVENQHTITQEFEMLTQRLSDLKKQNRYLTNDDKHDAPESSRRRLPPKDMKCFQCKLYGHVITDCPGWEGKPSNRWKYLHCSGFTRMDRHTKLSKEIASLSSPSTRPVTDVKARAIIESNMKRMSWLNNVCADLTLHSKEEATDTELDEEEFYKKIRRSNAYVAIESSKNISESDTDDDASNNDDSSDDQPITFSLREK
nr:uncharacterized protein LOC109784009 [Aegilops tauschii subsp. strangulata]